MRQLLESVVTAVSAVWVGSVCVAVWAPDLISGSAQEHLPLAALSVWLWTLTATGYVVMGAQRGGSASYVVGVVVIWAGVAVAAIAAPEMVTGTDPTRIPIAALLAPAIGTLATGFLALHQATSGRAS